ncbi:MAG: protein translocase subunit SecD [Candidatus Sumerlaeaceae bacterium]
MNNNNPMRIAVVAAVALLSLWLIYPTIRYFLAVSEKWPVPSQLAEAGTPQRVEAESKLDDLRRASVPLGLDLQGGVDVLLAVDTAKTRQSKVEEFSERLVQEFRQQSPTIDAKVEVTSGSESLQVTLNRSEQERSVDNILTRFKNDGVFKDYASGSIKAGTPLRIDIDKQALDYDVTKSVDSSIKVLRDRVDGLGVTQPVVAKEGTDRIRVQIPGEKDPERALSNIIRPAKLEFRGVYSKPAGTGPDGKPAFMDGSSEIVDVLSGKVLAGKQIPYGYEVRKHKRPKKREETTTETQYTYILVKKRSELTGAALRDARTNISQAGPNAGQWQVLVEFNKDGAKRFAQISQDFLYKQLAVMLDGVIYTAPTIQSHISEGNCEITGSFTQDEAHDLSLVLKAGALPAELVAKDRRTVEATLGADSIKASLFALLAGSLLVAAYMIAYYGMAGVIAVVAVFINVLLIFAFMRLASATLTLSGIGGILLTVGMAVDANILIYERIREEIKSGKNMRAAIITGFNRAYSVIFDTNLTTLISGLILLQFGEGSVKGFALALNIGILATLFTGLFVTRTLVDLWFSKTGGLNLGKFQWLRDNFNFDFIGLRKYSFAFSGILFLACALYIGVAGSNWGVDFEGGVLAEIETTKQVASHDVQGKYSDWRIQKVAGKNRFMVRAKTVTQDPNTQLIQTQKEITNRLDQTLGAGNYTVLGTTAVGTEVGAQFTRHAITACLVGSLCILGYLAFRFEFMFGLAAVIALFHDLIITYGLYNMFGRLDWAGDVTLDVVSGLLVVLGFSVHDTIIILDRIRENMRLRPGLKFREIIDLSISETMNRTISTVSTVLLVLIVMLIFGGGGLHDFALVLLIGIIKGAYSSSFIAAPILYELHERALRKGKHLKLRSQRPQSGAGEPGRRMAGSKA